MRLLYAASSAWANAADTIRRATSGLLAGLRKVIVRAAPTCTLWEPVWSADILVFKFNRRWIITAEEMMEIGR